MLGRVHVEGKEYAKAQKAYEEALARRPDFWPAANDLAALLCEHPGTGERSSTGRSALATSAYKVRPYDPIVQDTLGWAWYRKGDNPRRSICLRRRRGS